MAKILGVGGVFLSFKGDKDELHRWYYEHLGLLMSDYGTGFFEGGQLMLITFSKEMASDAIINFRVDDIEGMMKCLIHEGLETSEISHYPYGKFAHFLDPFGNKIELWEPNEENYREMVHQEIIRYEKKVK